MLKYQFGACCKCRSIQSVANALKSLLIQSEGQVKTPVGCVVHCTATTDLHVLGLFVVKLVSYCTGRTVYSTWSACNDTSRQKLIFLTAVQALAGACDMFTGAELAGLCREAAITALREDLQVQYTSLLVLSPITHSWL